MLEADQTAQQIQESNQISSKEPIRKFFIKRNLAGQLLQTQSVTAKSLPLGV